MALSAWRPALVNETDQQAIIQRIREIGHRLQKPEEVLKMGYIATMQSQYREIKSSLSNLQGLAQGLPGLAFMYGELNQVLPGEGWDQTAHSYLSLLQNEFSPEQYQSPSLFSGGCGFLFALHQLSCGGTRYQKALQQTKAMIFPLIDEYTHWLTLQNYFQSNHYALPDGAVGLVATLLTLAEEPSATEAKNIPREFLQLVEHLIWIGQRDIIRDVQQFGHWFVPSAFALQQRQMRWHAAESACHGYGLQQGLAGLVAILSICKTSQLNITLDPYISEAIQVLARQIRQGIHKDQSGWNWPLADINENNVLSNQVTIYSWCEGTCGIARALWLAGQVLDDNDLRTLALESISGVCQRFIQHPEPIGPALSHGIAGMMQVCARFVNDTEDPTLTTYLQTITEYLLDMFEADRPFGYRAFEPGFTRLDLPWLLRGAAGVVLAFSTLINPINPGWDRMMLLS